jgi:hypothetical protein
MHLRLLAIMTLALLIFPANLSAQQPQQFAVAIFGVHGPDKYAYLGPGIQSMLVSRLTWAGKLEPMDSAKLKRSLPVAVASADQAEQALKSLDIDYLVWGSTTILGDNASLDVNVSGKDGRTLTRQSSMPLSELIPGLEAMAREINTSLFERPTETTTQSAGTTAAGPIAGGQAAQNKANPLFQYESTSDQSGVWRSRSYPFTAEFMDIGDVDGDGRNEVVLAEQGRAHLLRIDEGELKPVESFALPKRSLMLAMNLFDIDGDGKEELVFSGWRDERPVSFVVGRRDGKLAIVRDNINLHLNVMRLPPLYRKTLVCQDQGTNDLFDRAGVRQISLEGPEPRIGAKLLTPTKGNLFNMAYLPMGADYKIAVIDDDEHLRTFNSTGSLQAKGEEEYNGTSVSLEFDKMAVPGMGRTQERNREQWFYYIPMAMATVDSDGNDEHELLVNLNISVAAQFFERYRAFSQGEIHAMRWDGVGMTTLWKTPRIKGTVMAYRMADAKNDGKQNLCVLVTTTPGLGSARSLLIIYDMAN